MDTVTSNYMPGDPRLIDQIVYELKSQGIFDQFRKECIADVDTKPAYQNLSQRVEGSVMNFLNKQVFTEDMNKNQLREQLRKNISESGLLETGVERIVDQVVNPKINTIFLPKVEDVVYRYLGIKKPNQEAKQQVKVKQEAKAVVVDLLPNDLEAVSPESVNDNTLNSSTEKKDSSIETNENSLNSSNTKTEDESPPFELLEENTKFSINENSVDSHLSGISGLASHDSSHSTEMKDVNSIDISQDITQNSISEGNLSIVTSEDSKMEICEDSNLSEIKEVQMENNIDKDNDKPSGKLSETIKLERQIDVDNIEKDKFLEVNAERTVEIKSINEIKSIDDKKEVEVKKTEDRKSSDAKSDSKKGYDKHKSSRSDKDRKDDKDKRSRSKSESKSKDHKDSKSSSKHSSSSKDKDRDKDKKDYVNGKDKDDCIEKDKPSKKEEKDRDKSKDKSHKIKDKAEKDKDKMTKDKDRLDKSHKEKSGKDKSDRDKEKSDREKNKSDREKSKSDRDKEKVDKDKLDKDKSEKEKSNVNKHSKEKSTSSSKKDSSSKEKPKSEDKTSKDKNSSSKDKMSSSSKHKESSSKDKDSSKSSKDKDKSRSSSSSTKDKDKDKDKKGGGDSKSKTSDKHKKSDKEKSSHHEKSHSSSKKSKDKKSVDDHYSLKDKKSDRRSTDRDSNDGSSKMSRNGSFTESYSQSFKGSSKESSEVFSSGSGDSSNSDKMEENTSERREDTGSTDVIKLEAPQSIKYIKPKFASNIHEAMKIMKIRKQLAKLERQNQLALAHVQAVKIKQGEINVEQNLKGLSVLIEKSSQELMEPKVDTGEKHVLPTKKQVKRTDSESSSKNNINNHVERKSVKEEAQDVKVDITEESAMLKSRDLSLESFEALEARLAQEMSNVDYHMYGEEDDSYEYSLVNISPVKKMKVLDKLKPSFKKIVFNADANVNGDEEIELVVNKQIQVSNEETPIIISDSDSEDQYEENIVTDEIVPRKEAVAEKIESNIIIENEVIAEEIESNIIIENEVEEGVDFISENVISESLDNENLNIAVKNEYEIAEESAECCQETMIQDIMYEKCETEIEKIKFDNSSCEAFGKKELDIDESDDFRGFNDVAKDNSRVIKFAQKISEMKKNLKEKLNETDKSDDISVVTEVIGKMGFQGKEDEVILKRGLSLKAAIKEVKNMSSTIQDLLQKNGKKLLIKIDKLEYELTPRVLVNLQDMETKQILNSHVCEVNKVSFGLREESRQMVQEEFKEKLFIVGDKVEESQVFKGNETKQNGQRLKQSNFCDLIPTKLNKNGYIEQKESKESDVKWELDDGPCFYFDSSDSRSEEHTRVLKDMIGRLEEAVIKLQMQSLNLQNYIPKPIKRGRKRKMQSTENNNSLDTQCKSASKKRHLDDVKSVQDTGSLCNTDVTSNQSFSLPLSPADSDKSEDHKKEEPVTVKTKRSGRGSMNSKRYSSEDLYKPRTILSSRRRRARPEEINP